MNLHFFINQFNFKIKTHNQSYFIYIFIAFPFLRINKNISMSKKSIKNLKLWQRMSLQLIYFEVSHMNLPQNSMENVFNECQKQQVQTGITIQQVESQLLLNQNIQLKIFINYLLPQIDYIEAIKISTAYHEKKLKQIFSSQNIQFLRYKIQQLFEPSSSNYQFKNIFNGLIKSVPRPTQIESINEKSLNYTKSNQTKYLFNKILYLQENLLFPGSDIILICEKLIVPKYIKNIMIDLSGKNGYTYPNAVQRQNAKQGQPGQHSGRLLIICLQYFSGTNVNYIGQGGNGGNGQNAYNTKIQNYVGPKLHYQHQNLWIDNNSPQPSTNDYRRQIQKNKHYLNDSIKLNQNRSIKQNDKIYYFQHKDMLTGFEQIHHAKKLNLLHEKVMSKGPFQITDYPKVQSDRFYTWNQNIMLRLSDVKNPRIAFVNSDENGIYQNGDGGIPGNKGQILAISRTKNLNDQFNIDTNIGKPGERGTTHIEYTNYKSHAVIQKHWQYRWKQQQDKFFKIYIIEKELTTQQFGFVQVNKIFDGNTFKQIEPKYYLKQANPQSNPKIFEKNVLFSFLDEQIFRLDTDKSYKYDMELLKIVLQQIYLFEFPTKYDEKNYQQSIYKICEKICKIILNQNVDLREALKIHYDFQKLSQLDFVSEKNDIKNFVNQVIRLKYSARNVVILDIFQYAKFQVQNEKQIVKELERIQDIQKQRKKNLDVLTKQTIQINDALAENTQQYTKTIQEYKNNCELISKNLKNQMQQKLDQALKQNAKNLQAIKNTLMVNSFLGVLNIGFTALSLVGGPVTMAVGAVGAGLTSSLVQKYSTQNKFQVDFEKLDVATSVFKICQRNQQKAQYKKNYNEIRQKIQNLQNKQNLTQDQVKQLNQVRKNEGELLKKKKLYKIAQGIQGTEQIIKSGAELVNNITEGLSQIQKNEIEKAKLQQYKNTVNNKFSQFLSSIEDIIKILLGFKSQFNSINENEVHERYVVALGCLKKIFQGLKQISINLSDEIIEFNNLYQAIMEEQNRDLLKQTNLFLDKINIDIAYIQKLEARLSTIQDVNMLVLFTNFTKSDYQVKQLQKAIHNYVQQKMYQYLKIYLIRRNIPMSLERFQLANKSFQRLQKNIFDFYSSNIQQTIEFPLLNGWIPLYTWKYQSYQNQFRNLFNGRNVTLSTSPVHKNQISAIKLLRMPRMILYVEKYEEVKIQRIKVFLKLNLKKNLYNVQNSIFAFNLDEKPDEQNYLSYSTQQIDLLIQPIETYKTMMANQNQINLNFTDSLKVNFLDTNDQIIKFKSKQYSPYGDWEVKLLFQHKKLSDSELKIIQTSILQLYGQCQYIQNINFKSNPYIFDDCYNKYKINMLEDQIKLIKQLKIINQDKVIEQKVIEQKVIEQKVIEQLKIPKKQHYQFQGKQVQVKNRGYLLSLPLCKCHMKKFKEGRVIEVIARDALLIKGNSQRVNQKFRFIASRDFTYKIQTLVETKCLDIVQWGDQNIIIQQDQNGKQSQNWILQPTGQPSQFFIKSAANGNYLQPITAGVIVAPFTKNTNQKWKIEILS